MADKQRPLRDLTRVINSYPGLFRDLVEACEEIARIGSIEQAEAEAKARMEKAREIAAAEHATLVDEIATRRRQAIADAEKVKADANVQATEILRAVEAARADQQAIAEATIDARNRDIDLLETHINERQQALDKLTADVEALTAMHVRGLEQFNTLKADTELMAAKRAELMNDIERLKAKF